MNWRFMTDIFFKDQIRYMLSQKMAEFSNAMNEIESAETEAIFADISAGRAEQRSFELETAISRMEGISAGSNQVNIFRAKLISFQSIMNYFRAKAYVYRTNSNIKSLVAKIDKIKAQQNQSKIKMEQNIRQESFKMLDWVDTKLEAGSEKIEKEISNIEKKINKAKDSDEKTKLLQQKAFLQVKSKKMKEMADKASQIKSIKDNKKAMKELFNFAKEMYVVANPNKTLNEYQLQQNLSQCAPKEDSVESYFKSVVSVWDMYLVDKKEVEADTGLSKLLKNVGFFGKVASVVAPISPICVMAVGASAAGSLLEPSASEELVQDEQTVDTFKGQLDNVTTVSSAIDNMDNQIQQIQGSVDRELENSQGLVEEFNEQLEYLTDELNHSQLNLDGFNNQGGLKKFETVILDTKNQISNLKIRKDFVESKIDEKHLEKDHLETQINNTNFVLKDNENENQNKTQNIVKETRKIKDLLDSNPDMKIEIASKLNNYLEKSSVKDDNTKVVLEKSFAMLQESLADVFGNQNVVVDKREGSRRSEKGRRTKNECVQNSQRDDSAGRRKGDRRQVNHVFIDEKFISKLNIQS